MGETGEISQLAEYVGPFSARAAQIGRNLDRYEAEWRAAHPGEEPGPALRRGWDARAWAENRPDKVVPASADVLRQRWLDELQDLGYRDPKRPAPVGDGGWVSWIATVAWPSCCPGWPPDAPGGTLPTSAAKSNSSLPEVA